MMKRSIIDYCDGRGPQIVEVEVPDLTSEEMAARDAKKAAFSERRKKFSATSPSD